MKLLLLISIFICLSFSSLTAQQKDYEVSFEQSHFSLGEIKHGDKMSGEFKFTNTGKQPLKIELVSSCECTTLEWTRKEILPTEHGSISFVFDSTEKTESETIDVDIYFEESDTISEDALFEIVSYDYILIK